MSTTGSRTGRPTSTSATRSIATREPSDYGGPYGADLRFTDFSKDALATKFLPWSEAYLQICVDGWAREVA